MRMKLWCIRNLFLPVSLAQFRVNHISRRLTLVLDVEFVLTNPLLAVKGEQMTRSFG